MVNIKLCLQIKNLNSNDNNIEKEASSLYTLVKIEPAKKELNKSYY